MATQTRGHLRLGAALASAAVIAGATPVMTTQAAPPTPTALSNAAYELTTLEDLLTIPTEVWTNILFGNTLFGGYVGPWVSDGDQYVGQSSGLILEPWATSCIFDCFNGSGISGAVYLAMAALVNGNGLGWEGRDDWNVGIVNYLFEPFFQTIIGSGAGGSFGVQTALAGLSAASEYLLQSTIGGCTPVEDGGGPCVPPALGPDPDLAYPNPIGQLVYYAYYGPYLLTLAWDGALTTVADLIDPIAPFVSTSLYAYLGDLLAPGSTIEDPFFYQPGLSGVLNYWVDLALGVYAPPAPAQTAPAQAAEPAEVEQAAVAAPEVVEQELAPAAGTGGADPAATEASPEVAAPTATAQPTAEFARATAAADNALAQPADEQTGSTADGAGTDTAAAPAADPRSAAEKAPRRGSRGAEKESTNSAAGGEQAKAGAASGRTASATAE